jgi:hypothetical protein
LGSSIAGASSSAGDAELIRQQAQEKFRGFEFQQQDALEDYIWRRDNAAAYDAGEFVPGGGTIDGEAALMGGGGGGSLPSGFYRGPNGIPRMEVRGTRDTPDLLEDADTGWYTTSEGVVQRVDYGPPAPGTSLPTVTITAKRDPADLPFDEQLVDQQIMQGTYNAFDAIGSAMTAGRWGDVWRYATYTPPEQVRNAAVARVFPQPSPDIARLDRMLASPIGTIAATAGRALGASQARQDALLATGSLLEQLGGASGNVYKQTLTAPAPIPGTYAAIRRTGPLPPVPPAPARGVLEFQGLEVRAVRDLDHLSVGTLRAMQKYGFAARDSNGNSLVLHHHQQNPMGPIIEMPASNHNIGNAAQHPFGNTKGMGLTPQERLAFDQWRVDYWKWRATQELQNRGLQ